ncbi:MAG: AmmeMemoRadiSam system radical SAM enzyme [candidate division Zixibacteria bacterium]|nr:AmmeMemoRadiSam system radical SAM enzyme [Candidatus Tariuqbacter arcticus]
MRRRTFLKKVGGTLLLAGCNSACVLSTAKGAAGNDEDEASWVEARYYEKLPFKRVKCTLCPRECVIDNLETGYCGVRTNRDGVYYTLVYGNPVTLHNDPIEKKPLFHFLPGTMAFSIATVGCNVNCKFCQNWEISQVGPGQVPSYDAPPEVIVNNAKRYGSSSIAYTYTEPVVFTEYMYDTAKLGRQRGVRSVMITNGYINPQPMIDLCGVLDAVKVDLKAFTQKFYDEMVTGELQPVLDILELIKKMGMWTEIVYLVIPTKNDDPGEIREMAQWIKSDLDTETPVHFSRYHPQYLVKNISPTPVSTLRKCHDICRGEGLNYVYIGNVPGNEAEKTYCPQCNEVVVDRIGYTIRAVNIVGGRCKNCGGSIAGVWI